MHYLASWSRKNLDFDVPWFLEKFLHIEFRVSKSRVRFRASRLETFLEFLCGSSDPHSSAPSAKGGLQENGESDLSSLDHCFFGGLDFTVSARDNRTPAAFANLLDSNLLAALPRTLPLGPMNTKPDSSQALAKSAFSARNPYPGWTASTLDSLAAFTIFSMLR